MVPGRERASRKASDCGKVKDNSLETGCNNSRLHPRGGRKDLGNANASTVGNYVLRKNTVFNYGEAFYSYSLNMLLQVARGLDAQLLVKQILGLRLERVRDSDSKTLEVPR